MNEYIDQPIESIDEDVRWGVWKKEGLVKIDDEQEEHGFQGKRQATWSGNELNCRWAAIVDTSSRRILSWRYVSPKDQCHWPYFHEGPW